jgi:hypothetical protein
MTVVGCWSELPTMRLRGQEHVLYISLSADRRRHAELEKRLNEAMKGAQQSWPDTQVKALSRCQFRAEEVPDSGWLGCIQG